MSEVSDSADRIRRIERAVFSVPRFIMGVLVLLIVIVTGANVVARYVFLAPFFWAEEALTYVMIAFVYVGAILVTWDGRHLKMDILSQLLKSPWKEALNLVSALLFIGIAAFVAIQSFRVTMIQAEFGKRSVAAEIPMVIPHSMIFIAFLFMAVIVIIRFRAYVKGEVGSDRDELVDDARATARTPGLGDGV